MIRKMTIAASMMALVTLTCAQDQSKSFPEIFGKKLPTARERGLDSLQKVHPRSTSFVRKMEMSKPIQAKSASSYTSRLDSLVTDLFYKVRFAYDENGNTTLEEYSLYYFPDGWIPEQRTERIYNDDNLPVEQIYSFWDPVLMAIEEEFRETLIYQEDGLVSEMIIYNWVADEWILTSKVEYTYDEEQNITESIQYQWDEANEIYLAQVQHSYVYNSTGGLITILISFWAENEWQISFQEAYTLNEDDNPVMIMFSEWNMEEEVWVTLDLTEIVYNAAGLEMEVVFWYDIDGTLIPDGKIEFEYDNLDRMIVQTFYFWEFMEEEWIGFYLDTYEYDAADNIVEYTYYMWDEELMDFVPEGKEIETFDTEIPSTDIMAPEGYAEFYNNKIISSVYSYFEDDEWTEEEMTHFYYSPLDPTSVKDASGIIVQVYPNPFRETIRLSGSQDLVHFSLYDLQGRVILQKQLNVDAEINTGNLPAGMYVYQIDGMNTRQTGKLVRE